MIDLFLVYSFIKRLASPFENWPAFKLGIIDKDGNILKKKRDLKTIEEKNAFGIYDLMILKLKKLLAKVPGGQSRMASYAAALWLIKEHEEIELNGEYLSEEDIEYKFNQYLHYTTESLDVNKKFEIMLEDGEGAAPVNSAGSGNIAGIGVGPKGEPGVSRKVQKKIQQNGTSVLKRFGTFDKLK
jgi:hypothetical protein